MRHPNTGYFTPPVGETYELVSEDKGFRFLAEKISHRPQIFVSNLESSNFEILSTIMPKGRASNYLWLDQDFIL